MTAGLWWLDFVAFWRDLARALEMKAAIDAMTVNWNAMRRHYKVKGRPKGAPNKSKELPLGEESL